MCGTEEYAKAVREFGIQSASASVAFVRMANAISEAFTAGLQAGLHHKTNNWRKMHGLPMRRRVRWR